jgi:hypothetical protein
LLLCMYSLLCYLDSSDSQNPMEKGSIPLPSCLSYTSNLKSYIMKQDITK